MNKINSNSKNITVPYLYINNSQIEESIENNEIACKAVKKFYEKRNNRLRLKKVIKKGMNWLRRRG